MKDLLSIISKYYPQIIEEECMNCPFCNDKDCSFEVWPLVEPNKEGFSPQSYDFYQCHNCSAKGDAISFLMIDQKMSFHDAKKEVNS